MGPDGTTWTMLRSLRNRLPLFCDFPMSLNAVNQPAARSGAVVLPPEMTRSSQDMDSKQDAAELREVPALDDWAAAVQCTLCQKWRPCSAEEAPKLSGADSGFVCKQVGFSCNQEQRFTTQEIDAVFS